MPTHSTTSLIDLSDSDLTIADPDADVRGRTIRDSDGEDVGRVKSILIDDREQKVRFLETESGGFLGIGGETRLVPVDAVTEVNDDEVRIDQTRAHVHGAPAYDPKLARNRAWDDPYYDTVYDYYGYMPYWTAGYGYPRYPRDHR